MKAASEITEAAAQKLQERFPGLRISDSRPVEGGCINACFRLISSQGNYFLKYNDDRQYPGMFEAEARGLRMLRNAAVVKIPEPVATGKAGRYSFMLMEWIESGRRQENFWNSFGRQLAALHKNTQAGFGLDHDNYIGSLSQSNKNYSSWNEFFIEQRIKPQLHAAVGNNRLDKSVIRNFDQLFNQLDEFIPEEKPSLLHGDLWSGNFMPGNQGEPVLIDPAVYYGHREMDLAMTRLFGGFDEAFYQSYNESFPLEKDFDKRADIHNLYPLLVHVNLFGGGYASQVRGILKRYI